MTSIQERGQRRHVASLISTPAFAHARSSILTISGTSQHEGKGRQGIWGEQRQAMIDEMDRDHLEWIQENLRGGGRYPLLW